MINTANENIRNENIRNENAVMINAADLDMRNKMVDLLKQLDDVSIESSVAEYRAKKENRFINFFYRFNRVLDDLRTELKGHIFQLSQEFMENEKSFCDLKDLAYAARDNEVNLYGVTSVLGDEYDRIRVVEMLKELGLATLDFEKTVEAVRMYKEIFDYTQPK